MFELRKKFVKIKQIKEGKDSPEEYMEIATNYNQTRCLACNSIIRKGNFLICTDCLDIGCQSYEKEAVKNETRRKK